MTQEQYVSFETAKLLKEKKFECEHSSITAMYDEIGVFLPLFTTVSDGLYYDFEDFDEYDFICPTQQVAMRWLREVHNIYVMIDKDSATINGWHYFIATKDIWENNVDKAVQQESNSYTYEEACEAAIKYCLRYLI